MVPIVDAAVTAKEMTRVVMTARYHVKLSLFIYSIIPVTSS